MEVRLTDADVGRRVVIRWRRPAADGGEEIADVIGVLEAADAASFTVRKASDEPVTIPRERTLAGKTIPPAPRRRRARDEQAGKAGSPSPSSRTPDEHGGGGDGPTSSE